MALSPEAKRVSAYLDTVNRLEPDITPIDTGPGLASIAISLKRIADLLAEMKAEHDAAQGPTTRRS